MREITDKQCQEAMRQAERGKVAVQIQDLREIADAQDKEALVWEGEVLRSPSAAKNCRAAAKVIREAADTLQVYREMLR